MNPIKYPIGIQNFPEIRTDGWAYVDKSRYVYQLATTSKHVFLSRPRRFGKSLLLSTIQAYFEGRSQLFAGLEIEKLEKEWKSYPVIRLDFSAMEAQDTVKLERYVNNRLSEYEELFGVKRNEGESSVGDRFGMLIRNVALKTGKKVVVLIDEYDKGIVDIMENAEQLSRNINTFRPFYAQLKAQDEHLRFVFLTGVSRFRNLTIFSSPNQLQDISMDPRYAAICGLTSEELCSVFAKGIEDLAHANDATVEETKEELRLQYDSYRFTRKEELVYNPFSILNCLSLQSYGGFWLASGGSSKVFIDYLRKAEYDVSDLSELWATEERLGAAYSTSDPIPLLFQTGYLTISDYKRGKYKLAIPNAEVRSALVDQLAPLYLGVDSNKTCLMVDRIADLVNSGDVDALMKEFQSIIGTFPHKDYKLNEVEHIYNLVLSLICQMAGVNSKSEVAVAGGDIDMVIESSKYVYVMEFKKDIGAEKALRQIDTHAYSLPWAADRRTVFKIGVEFSSSNRNIIDWSYTQA